jgi:hypothetical protein
MPSKPTIFPPLKTNIAPIFQSATPTLSDVFRALDTVNKNVAEIYSFLHFLSKQAIQQEADVLAAIAELDKDIRAAIGRLPGSGAGAAAQAAGHSGVGSGALAAAAALKKR